MEELVPHWRVAAPPLELTPDGTSVDAHAHVSAR